MPHTNHELETTDQPPIEEAVDTDQFGFDFESATDVEVEQATAPTAKTETSAKAVEDVAQIVPEAEAVAEGVAAAEPVSVPAEEAPTEVAKEAVVPVVAPREEK